MNKYWNDLQKWQAIRKWYKDLDHLLWNPWKYDIEVGDKVKHSIEIEGEDPWEEVTSVIYNNSSDFRNVNDGAFRVTINGYHWYIDDIAGLKKK